MALKYYQSTAEPLGQQATFLNIWPSSILICNTEAVRIILTVVF